MAIERTPTYCVLTTSCNRLSHTVGFHVQALVAESDLEPIPAFSIFNADDSGLPDPAVNLMVDDVAEIVRTKVVPERKSKWAEDLDACEARLFKNLTYILQNKEKWAIFHHVRALDHSNPAARCMHAFEPYLMLDFTGGSISWSLRAVLVQTP